MAGARKVGLEVTGSAGTISGDVDVLLRAMDGLLEHAIMATPEGGTVRVRLAQSPRPTVTVADGGAGLKQEDIRFDGHAIEVRLCSEDADHDFMPQSGKMLRWQMPDNIRVEHALHPRFIQHNGTRDAHIQRRCLAPHR